MSGKKVPRVRLNHSILIYLCLYICVVLRSATDRLNLSILTYLLFIYICACCKRIVRGRL